METLFVYGLVLAFFVLLIPVILFLMDSPTLPTEQAQQNRASSSSSAQPGKAAYGLLAGIFTFVFVITFLAHRGRS